MGELMLKCPATGRDFSTDIHIDEDSFRKLPDVVTKARCPHCDLMHSWWTREARLVGWYPAKPLGSVRSGVLNLRNAPPKKSPLGVCCTSATSHKNPRRG